MGTAGIGAAGMEGAAGVAMVIAESDAEIVDAIVGLVMNRQGAALGDPALWSPAASFGDQMYREIDGL